MNKNNQKNVETALIAVRIIDEYLKHEAEIYEDLKGSISLLREVLGDIE